MKKLILVIIAGLLAVGAGALNREVPEFRQKGYKGNIGAEPFCLIECPIVSLSHGYMFNAVHYLGGGASLTFYDRLATPMLGLFIDYSAYILKRNSTPVLGVRLGDLHIGWWRGKHIPFMRPTFGWSWGLGPGGKYGIMPFAGAQLQAAFCPEDEKPLKNLELYPTLGVVFEF